MTHTAPATGRNAVPDLVTDHPWPREWRGEWIGPTTVELSGVGLPEAAGPARFARHLYRAVLDLPSVPASAPLRVTADSRYALYINGREVGRGPVRSQPRRLRYDTYDVAALLREGSNRIVALVTYYGTPNAFWQPAPGTGNFGKTGVLVLEMELGSRWFGTGAHWEVREARAWSEPPRIGGLEGVPIERFDARLLEAHWAQGASGTWDPAQPQSVVHFAGLGRTRPPTDPFGPLLPPAHRRARRQRGVAGDRCSGRRASRRRGGRVSGRPRVGGLDGRGRRSRRDQSR